MQVACRARAGGMIIQIGTWIFGEKPGFQEKTLFAMLGVVVKWS